ncbi:MAG: hypothetical protein PUF71_05320 [Firmicutes bacterium]|nr:hypothetical protein [Bacillota bacterium]
MTEVTPHPLKTQGFHHFLILLFYDHPAMPLLLLSKSNPLRWASIWCWVQT